MQSQRLPLYRQHADALLASGAAYRCFCDAQRLDVVRSLARVEGRTTAYDRFCRSLPVATVQGTSEACPRSTRASAACRPSTVVGTCGGVCVWERKGGGGRCL